MAPSITHWRAAMVRINELRDTCEAFVRGDQPEKIDHLDFHDIVKLRDEVLTVLNFCTAIMESPRAISYNEGETYKLARQYAINLTNVLLHHPMIASHRETEMTLNDWCQNVAPQLPRLTSAFV